MANAEYRTRKITPMLHILFSRLEESRGYGGDLPASPYTPILDELEKWMREDGVPYPPKPGDRPKVHEVDLP